MTARTVLQQIQRKFRADWIKLLTSRFGVKYIYLPIIDKPEDRKISVVITHFNRSNLIYLPLRNVIYDTRISEIVIYDDGSNAREFKAMQSKLAGICKKIRIVRSEVNSGAFRAKLEAIKLAKEEWVILLDSDNFLFRRYLNVLFRIKNWNANTIYCADFAFPQYDFTRWGGKTFDLDEIQRLCRQKEFDILMLLNDGNYFVNRERYVIIAEPFKQIDVAAADVLALNYLWLDGGNKLQVLKNVKYYHSVHGMSYFLNTEKKSTGIVEEICDSIITGRKHQFY